MIQVVNGPQFVAAMKRKAAVLNKTVEIAVAKSAKDIQRDSANNTPVISGDLQKGWKSGRVAKWEWEVKNDVEYGPYVEFGTVKMAPRHMMTKAIHRNEPQLKETVNEAITKGLMA